MKVLRTPDERFQDLHDYPFEPNFVEVADGLRMHYVDEGPRDADPVLMLHGEPSWSYLYRTMIPVCAEHHRVIAPDLIGFGKSDKPSRVSDYSYQSHMDWITAFVEALDLQRITLFAQDWGSLLGLRLAAEQSERFDRIVLGNGFLVTGEERKPTVFKVWQAFARWSPWFPISRIINQGSFKTLTPDERRAYDAPFPTNAHKAGSRAFPRLVPMTPKDPASEPNRRAWEVLAAWEKPFLLTFSNGDPITRGVDKIMKKKVPGTAGLPHIKVRGGHFLQEDAGPELAEAINNLIASTP